VLGAGIDCCPGLDRVMDCDPASDPECSGKEFCVDCGNGVCEGHENRDNCREDCVEGCGGYSGYGYTCTFWEFHYCSCGWGECFPICDTVDGVTGWYELCTMRLMLMDDGCGDCRMFDCRDMGTPYEGWYSACTGELIELGPCASEWSCEISHTP